MMTKGFYLYLSVSILLFCSLGASVEAEEKQQEQSYLAAVEKHQQNEMLDYFGFFKDIINLKIHWLKPKENADGTVRLKWELPDPYLTKYHQLDRILLTVIDAQTGKLITKKYLNIKYKSYTYRFPKYGQYKLIIGALNKQNNFSDQTFFTYTYRKYITRLSAAAKHAIVTDFYSFLDKYKYEFECSNKYIEFRVQLFLDLIKKWADNQGKVYTVKLSEDYLGVILNFIDNSSIYLRVDDILSPFAQLPEEGQDFSGSHDTDPYPIDDVYRGPDIARYIPPPVFPGSNRAIVFHGLALEEVGATYPDEIMEPALVAAGFDDVTIVQPDDQDALRKLKNIDNEQYGFIYYLHHGGTVELDGEDYFAAGIPPYYDVEPEIEHLGVGTAAKRFNGELKYYRYFTRLFVDTYVNDMPFPRSFIYWYSCGSARDVSTVADLHSSLVEKGVTTGWVGMDNANARISFNNTATRRFFNLLDNKPYLGDAVSRSRLAGSDLKLLNAELTQFNRAMHMDHDFVDLGIRRIEQAENRMIKLVIGNEGTINPVPDTEITIGTKDSWPEEGAFINTVNFIIPDRLQRGETMEVLVPPTESHSWLVGLDINNDLADEIMDNNSQTVFGGIFLPDLIIADCQRTGEDTLQITITNNGLADSSLPPGVEEFFLDISFNQQDMMRIGTRFPEWSLLSGGSYQVELHIPQNLRQVDVKVDSTEVIEEFNEENDFSCEFN